MRIRSIRPEFWASEDVAGMDWATRLVFIGLWSYVDDNGVGRDSERLVVAALFPLDEDFPEASRRVTGALRHLSDHGQITRYTVDGKTYLHITAWSKHQRIEKRSTGRYPLPTCGNAHVPPPSGRTPGGLPEGSAPGEGEKGRRGEGEKTTARAAPAAQPQLLPTPTAGFDEFWAAYPRRTGKAAARKAWDKAVRTTSPRRVIDGAARFAADPNLPTGDEAGFVPHPSTWLNDGRWDDDPLPPRHRPRSKQEVEQAARDDWYARSMARAAEYDAEHPTPRSA